MPSPNEIKQMMEEKVIPFFDGAGLKSLVSKIEALEEVNRQALKDLAKKNADAAKEEKEAAEKARKKAEAEAEAKRKKELEEQKAKRRGQPKDVEPDVEAEVSIDQKTGMAKTVVKKEKVNK